MPGAFESVLKEFQRTTVGQKVRLLLALLATVGVIWGVVEYANRVRYGTLFARMDPEDAGRVKGELEERNVPYRLASGGRVIEVPVGQIDELRMELAVEGLPHGGGVGFEIFDKPSFGLSDFVQNVNYRRALERELGRSVQSLEIVDSARVHLALPPESVFADEKQKASASVLVHLRGRGSLSAERVRAITYLVASGVEGLDSSAVSVVDSHGRLLSDGVDHGDDALSVAQLELKRATEAHIEKILLGILEPMIGLGKVRARATVELETARVERVEEVYDPDGAVVRSEQKNKTTSSGGAGGGVPGTASNVPGGTNIPAQAVEAQESIATTTNFEINKTISTTAEPRGGLARQSVAVVVDHATTTTEDAEGIETSLPVPRTLEEMRKITGLVRAAVGIDESRGDLLIVENIPFDETMNPTKYPAEEGLDWVYVTTQVLRYLTVPLAVLLIALLVIRPGLKALRALRPELPASDAPPTVGELQARLGSASLGHEPGSTLQQKLIEATSEDPEAAALVVRGWLGQQAGE